MTISPEMILVGLTLMALVIGIIRQIQSSHQIALLLEQQANQLQRDLSTVLLSSYQTGFKQVQESLELSISHSRKQVTEALNQQSQLQTQQSRQLTDLVHQRLQEISGQVEKRLAEGFEKTTATFADVVKRLALIDEAQKKITELSTSVVSLQSLLNDKRSRGAFGEVQLAALVRNLLPESNISFQHTLSNGRRADCILFLPEPTGNIVIDAKFPLENYHRLTVADASQSDKKIFEQQFRIDIRKHIDDISSKYIILGETSDGAMMFLPAEAIFAEIHSHFPDLVEYAQRNKVWMVSPTTTMAILTTASAVLKDAATKQQVHAIQEHLGFLAKDFDRFQKRMDNLAKHISQAKEDVDDVNTSARKLTSRFMKIEKVEVTSLPETVD